MSVPLAPAGDKGLERIETMHAATLDQRCQGAGFRWRRKPVVAIEPVVKHLVRRHQNAALPQTGNCVQLHVVVSLCHAHLTPDSAQSLL